LSRYLPGLALWLADRWQRWRPGPANPARSPGPDMFALANRPSQLMGELFAQVKSRQPNAAD
jgi:hypothetical protein